MHMPNTNRDKSPKLDDSFFADDPFADDVFLMDERPLKVFICYSHKDYVQVYSLHQKLSSNGVDTWLDKNNLLPGQDWELEITKAVRGADIFVACLTREFVSKSGFSQKEIRLALDVAEEQPEGTIFIIPLRLEECEVPDRLRRWHWCDLFEQTGYEQLKKSLKTRASQIAEKEVLVSKLDQATVVGVSEPYRFAKVVISRSGDSVIDAARVGEVHHLLASYPGPDRFCLLIKARGETLQLDFPHDTTTLDDMMIDQLKSLHGVESVQISMSL
jgi:hypothetical protein